MTAGYGGIFEDWEIAIAVKIVRDYRLRWRCLYREEEDFLLSGCLAHWYRRRETYREGKQAVLKSYMGKVLKNYLMSFLRKELAEKRKTDYLAASLNQPIDARDPESPSLGETLPSRSPDPAFLLDVRASLEKLTPRQREICKLLAQRAAKSDIAASIRISRDTVHEELKRIREVFRKDELEKYL